MSRLGGARVPPFVAAAIAPVWAGHQGRCISAWTIHNPISTPLTGPIAPRAPAWQYSRRVARPDDEAASGIIGFEYDRALQRRCSMLDIT